MVRQMSPKTAPPLRRALLRDLTIDDAESFRHVGLYADLAAVVEKLGIRFRILGPNESWDRALFLNLTFWGAAEGGDVLLEARLPADVVAHVGWHALAARALLEQATAPSSDGLFLGEAIASAFDLYLVGRLLGHAPDSSFLETQVPAMAECAEAAGVDEAAFEALLAELVAAPEAAFEDLRQLLFHTTRALFRCRTVDEAQAVFAEPFIATHRFACLLHRHELSNWVLYGRAYAADRDVPADDERARAVDAALRAAPDALAWLTKEWVDPALAT
jgi:hypothetical protein